MNLSSVYTQSHNTRFGLSNPYMMNNAFAGNGNCCGIGDACAMDPFMMQQANQMMVMELMQMLMTMMSGQMSGNNMMSHMMGQSESCPMDFSGPCNDGYGNGSNYANSLMDSFGDSQWEQQDSQASQSTSNNSAQVGAKTGDIVSIPGGQVDSSIAENVTAMMAEAKKDGVDLEIASSFRTRAQQEKLYAAYKNGTGNLAAKPGTSMHEKGLALDFSNTPGAHAWLKKNAERFGLKNLPSEPWHYSTTGH